MGSPMLPARQLRFFEPTEWEWYEWRDSVDVAA